jgi:outer membrane protein assembly factor BamD
LASSVRVALAGASFALLLAGCGASIAPQIHTDADRVTVARRLYDKGEFALAVETLSGYVTTGSGSADIDAAVYLLGLAYLRQHEYASAQTQFERIQSDYPESDSANAAAFRLGDALLGQSRASDFDQEFTLKALDKWQALEQAAPDDPWAALARTRIAECRSRLARKLWRTGDLYVKLKYYQPAKLYFGSILKDYSDTPVYGDAIIGMAMADARLGRRDSALAVLRGLEKEFAGRALGIRAAEVRARMEKWPAAGDVRRPRHRSSEATQPPVQPTMPSTPTSFEP